MPRLSKALILRGIGTHSRTEEAELHIFGSQCKAEVRKPNFTSWGIIAEWKSGSGTSDIGSNGREEVWKRKFTFLAINAEC